MGAQVIRFRRPLGALDEQCPALARVIERACRVGVPRAPIEEMVERTMRDIEQRDRERMNTRSRQGREKGGL